MRNLQLTDGKQVRYLVLISIVVFAINLPRIAAGGSFVPTPTKTQPIMSVKSFGAKGDGVKDDTQAIQNAMNSMANGGTLEFPAGTYKYSKSLILLKPNVKLWGYGATLTPTNATSQAIQLLANSTHIYGFKKVAPTNWQREACWACYGIVARQSSNHEIIDNEIRYGSGIIVSGANVLIGRNVVYRTVADAIHVTGASKDVRVLQNTVRENGDDMIAVVSYGGPDSYRVNNVLIEDNDVAGNYWGRGITAVGGDNITIRNNVARLTGHGPGILVYSQTNAAYSITSVNNVLVEGNLVQDSETVKPAYNPRGAWVRLGWGGIHIAGYYGVNNRAENVMVRNNTIRNTYKDGIMVWGYASKVGLVGNRISNAGRDPIVGYQLTTSDKKIACSGNTYNGNAVSHPSCGAPMPIVTGSSLGTAIPPPVVPPVVPPPVLFRSAANSLVGQNDTTTITKPVGVVDGDILLAHIYAEPDGHAITAPSGWTLIVNVENVPSDFRSAWYWKRATGEGSNYVFTSTGSIWLGGAIAAYSGAIASGNPIDAFGSGNVGGSNTSAVATSITTTVANTLVVFGSHQFHLPPTLTPPAGMAERLDADLSYFADVSQAAAGATGSKTSTLSAADFWSANLIALKPAIHHQ